MDGREPGLGEVHQVDEEPAVALRLGGEPAADGVAEAALARAPDEDDEVQGMAWHGASSRMRATRGWHLDAAGGVGERSQGSIERSDRGGRADAGPDARLR